MSPAHDDGGEDRLAPVIPLFGGKMTRASELARDEAPTEPRSTATPVHSSVQGRRPPQRPEESDPDDVARHAEGALVRKLRARSLSVSEARQVLRGQGLDAAGIDDVIDRFCERGYLDDALLAEHLVISGIERKGQGRVALSRALAQRGVPRDVIDAALGDLPDDDAERALEFARTKARSLSRLDFDTALRRLMGQLARRGYGGSVAMTAARTALAEASLGGPTTGVRFVDSD
ncbi:regulatory protein RecX [Microbacterium sp.]|uniref:regulatory protein RecX n=1 Tax=Microbacterium sp. TaxID=51671 RepID=UPI003A90D432